MAERRARHRAGRSTTTARSPAMLTERDLARRYIRESRERVELRRRARRRSGRSSRCSTARSSVARRRRRQRPRCGCSRWTSTTMGSIDRRGRHRGGRRPRGRAAAGDRARRRAAGVANGIASPTRRCWRLARAARHRRSCVSPLDSYVTRPHDPLSVPVRAVMERRPADRRARRRARPTSRDEITRRPLPRRGRGRRRRRRPVGLVDPRRAGRTPRRARCCWSTTPSRPRASPGIEQAEIVEILDHHHIGSIETRVPVRATFDPVGSTATLVVERFRPDGREPQPPDRDDAAGGDPLRHRHPQLADHDRARPRASSTTSRSCWRSTPASSAREMFEASSDVAGRRGRGDRRARRQGVRGRATGARVCVAQIETVGRGAARRARPSCWTRWRPSARAEGYVALGADGHRHRRARAPTLLVAGDVAPLERAFGERRRTTA